MLVSGFIDGQLIYILEFPFNTATLINKLEKQLKKRFPEGDICGQFLRSANFDFHDFISSDEVKVVYLLEKNKLKSMSNYINKNFFSYLMKESHD